MHVVAVFSEVRTIGRRYGPFSEYFKKKLEGDTGTRLIIRRHEITAKVNSYDIKLQVRSVPRLLEGMVEVALKPRRDKTHHHT